MELVGTGSYGEVWRARTALVSVDAVRDPGVRIGGSLLPSDWSCGSVEQAWSDITGNLQKALLSTVVHQ